LQVSIIMKNDLENHFTIGAEYYHPNFVKVIEKINASSHQVKPLGQICELITDGDHGAMQYEKNGILFLLSESIKEGYIDLSVKRYISNDRHNKLKRSQLKQDDVVLTKTGVYYGKSAVIPGGFPQANTSAHVGVLKVIKNIVNPYYLSTFFNSKYGYLQLRRRGIKVSRPEIKLIEFDDIKIVLLDMNFQMIIEKIVKESIELIKKSNNLYNEAEGLLLNEVGLGNWNGRGEPFFIKTYLDVEKVKRIDAEYFQPKYENLINIIKKYTNGYDSLDNIVKITKCIEVGSNEYQESGIPFIRVSNLLTIEISDNNLIFISENLYEKLKRFQPKKNEILLSKDATPGIAHHLDKGPEKMILSGGILRLKIKDKRLNEETLTLILNSIIVQQQVERDSGGSVIEHWRVDQVKNTLIPLINEKINQEICNNIRKSFINCDWEYRAV